MKVMRILIGADVVATDRNECYFKSGDMKSVVGDDLYNLLQSSDFNVFNIEGPITNTFNPIRKCGPNLIIKEETINGYKKLNPGLVTIANNHIMDQGDVGLRSTIALLKEWDINYIGAGMDLAKASEPYIFEMEGKKIGFYACAEHEFTIAKTDKSGANPYDPLFTFDDISNLRKICDYVIVLYHGGKEFYRYPSPNIQKIFRKMSDKGANLVVAQHTHCIGAYEEYNGSYLVYGQGNFIFDRASDEYWNSGLLLSIDITDNKMNLDFIPFIKRENGTIQMIKDEDKESLMNEYFERSKRIQDESFVENEYRNFCRRNLENYLRVIHGNNLLFKIINKLVGGKLIFKVYNSRSMLALLNYIECEAHNELLITSIKDYENLK